MRLSRRNVHNRLRDPALLVPPRAGNWAAARGLHRFCVRASPRSFFYKAKETKMTGLYVAYNFQSKPVECENRYDTGWAILTEKGDPTSMHDIDEIRFLILGENPSYQDVFPVFWFELPGSDNDPT
jgi:hypothetical protein